MYLLKKSAISSVIYFLCLFECAHSSAACERSFVVEDQTNFPLTSLSAHGEAITSGGFLGNIFSRIGRIIVRGEGHALFVAKISTGQIIEGAISNVCSATQIIITEKSGKLIMIIR